MKFLKQISAAFGFFVLTSLIIHCGRNNEEISGWGSETTNGISGVVTHTDGYVPGANIAVYPTNHNPFKDGQLPGSHLSKSNSLGEYSLNGLGPGSYNIKVYDPASGKYGLAQNIAYNNIPVQVPEIQIQPGKTLVLSTSGTAITGEGYIYIPGTGISTSVSPVELNKGTVFITGIPEGHYGELIYYNQISDQFFNLINTIVSFPQDTVVINRPPVELIEDGVMQQVATVFLVPRPISEEALYKTGNRVSGILQDPAGQPVSDVTVNLMPNDYNPLVSTNELNMSTRSDFSGYYQFDDVPAGNYRVEANHTVKNLVSFQDHIQVAGDYTVLLPKNMQKPGTLVYYLPEDFIGRGGDILLSGSSYSTTITPEDLKRGSVVLNSITPKHYTSLVYYGSDGASNSLFGSLDIQSERQTFIHPYQDWNHWRSISYTTPQTAESQSEELLGFPLLIRLSAFNFNFSQSQGDGSDLRFTSGRNFAPLDYSIESWDPVDRSASIWVKLDTIFSSNIRHVINMHWGKSEVFTRSSSVNVFDKNEGYVGVWQFDGVFINGESVVEDKSGNGNDGITVNMNPSSVSMGLAGNSLLFDGFDDYIRIPDDPSLNFGRGDFTLSAFFITGPSNDQNQILCKRNKDINKTVGNYEFQVDSYNRVVTSLENTVENNNGQFDTFASQDKIDKFNWNHVAIVRKNYEVTMYLNGEIQPNGIRVNKHVSSSADLLIGMDPYLSNEGLFGYIDEVRISKVARSTAWIKMSFESQRSGARVLEFGPSVK